MVLLKSADVARHVAMVLYLFTTLCGYEISRALNLHFHNDWML